MKWHEYRRWVKERRANAEWERQLLELEYFKAINAGDPDGVLSALLRRIARGWSVPS